MKIAPRLLNRYISGLPTGHDLVELMEDVGLEVKRHEGDQWTLELLANRGDHHCYFGLAREIGGRTGGALCFPDTARLELGKSPVPLRCETDTCLVYTATLLERIAEPVGLDADTLAPLEGAGIHSLTAPVDATNLSNTEIGQPTHAFDADTLDGAITIRLSRKGERCWPLFHDGLIELPEGTLVIADDSKILAVAGVIGCEESKTTEATRRLLLESACFDPVSVRKASRALSIHTDSSARFERGSDPSLAAVGAGRVVKLLESTGAWKQVGTTGRVGHWIDPERRIRLDVPAANAFLATSLSADEAYERLSRYGFVREGDCVRVPPHRLWDVETPFDLYEELAKSIGYNDTPTTLPAVDMGSLPSVEERNRAKVDQVLVANGFFEVVTDGFYGREGFSRLGLRESHALHAHVETQNALDRGYSLLKNNCVLQAVSAAAKNLNRKVDNLKMWEWTRTFHPDSGAENGVCFEQRRLWGLCAGTDRLTTWAGTTRVADVLYLKGLITELGVVLGTPLELGPASASHPLSDLLHPNRQAVVLKNGAVIGIVGEVHPRVCKAHKIKRVRPCYFELDEALLLSAEKRPLFVQPADYHPIERSLAFTLPGRIEAGAVRDLLLATGPETLTSVAIADLYEHEEQGTPLRTITYALRYANPEHDATADEVNAATEALIAKVSEVYGDKGVRLRV